MVEMMNASRSYQNNVEVVNTAKELLMRTLDVLKSQENMVISEIKNESYIRTTDMLEEQKMKAAAEEETLGRDAFLTLFTTQLKNQNPLDPMGNEAFVAQLAQFSQVEGIKGMQNSMEELEYGDFRNKK